MDIRIATVQVEEPVYFVNNILLPKLVGGAPFLLIEEVVQCNNHILELNVGMLMSPVKFSIQKNFISLYSGVKIKNLKSCRDLYSNGCPSPIRADYYSCGFYIEQFNFLNQTSFMGSRQNGFYSFLAVGEDCIKQSYRAWLQRPFNQNHALLSTMLEIVNNNLEKTSLIRII